MADDVSFALDAIKKKFKLSSLRDYQEAFFFKFAKGSKDFFIGQPTGNGKSLLFQGLSCFKSELLQSRKCCIAMVIAPLTALIEDQILLLAKKEVVAKRIDQELVGTTAMFRFNLIRFIFITQTARLTFPLQID
eukprot:TCONS_00032989-protein